MKRRQAEKLAENMINQDQCERYRGSTKARLLSWYRGRLPRFGNSMQKWQQRRKA